MKIDKTQGVKVTATNQSNRIVYSKFDHFESLSEIKNDVLLKCKGDGLLFVTYSQPNSGEGDSFSIKA